MDLVRCLGAEVGRAKVKLLTCGTFHAFAVLKRSRKSFRAFLASAPTTMLSHTQEIGSAEVKQAHKGTKELKGVCVEQ